MPKGQYPRQRKRATKQSPEPTTADSEAARIAAFELASQRRRKMEADISELIEGQRSIFQQLAQLCGGRPVNQIDTLNAQLSTSNAGQSAPTPSAIDHDKLHLQIEEAVSAFNKCREAQDQALAAFERTGSTWSAVKAARDALSLTSHQLIEAHRKLAQVCANI